MESEKHLIYILHYNYFLQCCVSTRYQILIFPSNHWFLRFNFWNWLSWIRQDWIQRSKSPGSTMRICTLGRFLEDTLVGCLLSRIGFFQRGCNWQGWSICTHQNIWVLFSWIGSRNRSRRHGERGFCLWILPASGSFSAEYWGGGFSFLPYWFTQSQSQSLRCVWTLHSLSSR